VTSVTGGARRLSAAAGKRQEQVPPSARATGRSVSRRLDA